MVWYGMVYVNLYSAIVANVSNALGTLAPRKQPSFQALFFFQSPAVCGGRQAKSSKPSGHAQRMLGGQQWTAGVVAQPSATGMVN